MKNSNLIVMVIIPLMFALTFNADARRDPASASSFSSRRSNSPSAFTPSRSYESRTATAPAPAPRPAAVTRSAPVQRAETRRDPAPSPVYSSRTPPLARAAPDSLPEPRPPAPAPSFRRAEPTRLPSPAPAMPSRSDLQAPATTRVRAAPAAPSRAVPAMPSRSDLQAPATTRVRAAPAAPSRDRPDVRPAAEPYVNPLRTASSTRSTPAASHRVPIADAPVSLGRIKPESGVSRLAFGSSLDTHGLTHGRTNPALSLRSTVSRSSPGIMSFDKSPPMSASRPSRSVGTPRLTTASLPKTQPMRSFGSSRHTDGRNTLYHPPTREHHAGYRPYRPHRQSHHRPYHRSYRQPYWFNPWTFSYQHYGFMPFWYPQPYFYPYYYPQYYAYPASGFGFSWSSGSFGLSFFSYTPAYSTFYYDSWHCGGWGYSRIYSDGWRSGWYGGMSYIYNPWPVYRNIYLYEPAPTVINTETVYVTEPSTVIYSTAQPAAADNQPAAQINTAAAAPTLWDSAPVEERVETLTTRCFCRCGCNGQRPCTCEYPCGAEYTYQPEDFDLSLDYVSYSETLDPETIWLSYAGLDYWETNTDRYNSRSTAAY